jgi:hypothetical protein
MHSSTYSTTKPAPFRRNSRAAFSPIRAGNGLPLGGVRTNGGRSPAFAAALGNLSAPLPRPWPAWHRGPLDRMQPILTRYRD